MLWPYQRASQRGIQQSFSHQELGTFPFGQSLSGAGRQVQHIPPTLDRETFACVYTLVLVQLPLAVMLCWHLPVYFPLLQIPPGWAAQDRSTPPLLLPLQVTSAPSCESSVSISAESHWHSLRKEATPLRQEGNKVNSSRFQKYMQKLSMLPTLKPQGWLLLHPALSYFFWDLLHQGSGFLIFKQLHLVISEQLEWSYSPFMQRKALEVFVAVPEEELGSRRDLAGE